MAKDKTVYVCDYCGQESLRWVGKCPACGRKRIIGDFIPARRVGCPGCGEVRRQGHGGRVIDKRVGGEVYYPAALAGRNGGGVAQRIRRRGAVRRDGRGSVAARRVAGRAAKQPGEGADGVRRYEVALRHNSLSAGVAPGIRAGRASVADRAGAVLALDGRLRGIASRLDVLGDKRRDG